MFIHASRVNQIFLICHVTCFIMHVHIFLVVVLMQERMCGLALNIPCGHSSRKKIFGEGG